MTDPNISLVATGDNAKQIGYIGNIEVFKQIIQVTSWQELETLQLRTTSPYKGLKSFEAVDQRLFFGRDQFLKERFQELGQSSFILLLGASGSGKSSIVRAGIIPQLANSLGSQFIDLTFIPKHDPFASLYHRLHDRYSRLDCEFILEGTAETLVQAVKQLKPADDFWFIFIDQFEELFTLSDGQKRDRFIESLVQLVKFLHKTQNQSVKLIATMRADFLDRLSPYPAFVKLTDQHRPIIAEMQLDELRLAIEQPALHHGVIFEQGLVEEIIKDVWGQAGYLPLLQYTLDLLWKTEVATGSIGDRTLNIHTYRDLGGVRGTLQKRVEDVYQGLSQPEQLAVQRIFLQLVGIGGDEKAETGWRPIRRRANRSEFEDQLDQKMIARLINESLLVSNRETQLQEATVEIAHEVLLTAWTTLSTWIQKNRETIALRNRLNDDVKRWQATRSDDELWGGSKLEQALELRRDSVFNSVLGGFSAAATQFLDTSVGRRDRQKRRFLAGVFAFCALLTASGIGFGLQQQREKQAVEAVFLSADAPTPDLLDRLPAFLAAADERRKEIDQFKGKDSPNEALAYYQQKAASFQPVFAYYRKILTATIKLQTQLQNDSDIQKVQAIHTAAEQALAELMTTYRIPQLQQELKAKQYSTIHVSGTGSEQFTPGALRTTYEILMLNAGADLDGNGELQTQEEAEQIPCITLEDIEKLWRELVDNQCAWFSQTLPNGEFEAPECKPTNGYTLSYSLLQSTGYETVIDRLKQCRADSSGTENTLAPPKSD